MSDKLTAYLSALARPDHSVSQEAEQVMGRRGEGIPIDQPCELGYHCPVCEYLLSDGEDYDERLLWSEYRGFLWCSVCNKDYPSALCQPDVDRAIEIFLASVAEAKEPSTSAASPHSDQPNGR